jgi:hypothetical protein
MDREWVVNQWDLVVLTRWLDGGEFRMVLESSKIKRMKFKNK